MSRIICSPVCVSKFSDVSKPNKFNQFSLLVVLDPTDEKQKKFLDFLEKEEKEHVGEYRPQNPVIKADKIKDKETGNLVEDKVKKQVSFRIVNDAQKGKLQPLIRDKNGDILTEVEEIPFGSKVKVLFEEVKYNKPCVGMKLELLEVHIIEKAEFKAAYVPPSAEDIANRIVMDWE